MMNCTAPAATVWSDTKVDTYIDERLLFVWTLRSLNPTKDGFKTLSWTMVDHGGTFEVFELVDGATPNNHFNQSFSASEKDKALDYFHSQVRMATPPCTQPALPGLLPFAADYIETYAYRGEHSDFGGAPCEQSHYRIGSWS